MDIAEFQSNFVYDQNRQQTGFGLWAVVCQLLIRMWQDGGTILDRVVQKDLIETWTKWRWGNEP